MKFPLYLPSSTSKSLSHVLPGSAIVGLPSELGHENPPGKSIVYYEGSKNYANIITFADRAMNAAGRLLPKYPTIAFAVVDTSDLVLIGELDMKLGTVSLINNSAATSLTTWLDDPSLTPESLEQELATSNDRASTFRTLSKLLKSHSPHSYAPYVKQQYTKIIATQDSTIKQMLDQRAARSR